MAKYHDPNGRHIRVYVDLTDSPAYCALSWTARSLFWDLRATLGKTNNGDLMASMMGRPHKGLSLHERGWRSPTTLAMSLYELRSAGLLVQTRAGGVESGSKVCALYAFTDVDIFEQPKHGFGYIKASHDYRKFATVADAERAIRAGVAELHALAAEKKAAAKARKEKMTLQKMERDAPENGAMSASNAPANGAEAPSTLQNLEQRNRGANRAATRMDKGSAPESAPASDIAPSAPKNGVLCITATPGGAAGTAGTAAQSIGNTRGPSKAARGRRGELTAP